MVTGIVRGRVKTGVLLLSVVLLSGCACFETQAGHKIDQVQFVGNHHVADATLLDQLHSQPDSCWPCTDATLYDPDALGSDARRVQAHLVALGYRDARVTAEPATSPEADWVDVRFKIDEGEPTRVASVRILRPPGDRGPVVDERELGLRPGDVLAMATYRSSKEAIRQRLVAHGYFHALVTGRITLTGDHHAAIEVTVDSGPLVRFGVTTVQGAHGVPEANVLARVAWNEGDVYDPELVDLTQRRLYALGRFASVQFDPTVHAPERPATLHMIVIVSEADGYEARLGVGWATDQVHSELHASGGIAVHGLGDVVPMGTLRLDGLIAQPFLFETREWLDLEYKLAASFVHEDLVLPRLRGTATADYSQQVTETYTLQGPRASLALDRGFFRDRLTLLAGWQGRWQELVGFADALSDDVRTQIGLVDPYHEASYFQAITVDLRDNPLDTHQGFYAELHLQEGGGVAGGDFEYAKVSPDLRGYLPLGRHVVVGARARLGLGFGLGGDPVPESERFFAGGPNSQRGFAQQHLSPFVTGTDGKTATIGGEALIETSVESRLDLFRVRGVWIQGVLFLDGADVTARRGQLDVTDLHWATGLGLRAKTPVGPVRLDLGRRLNRTGAGEPDAGDHYAFFFALGEAF
jgi:translocation and assembly module TamA